MWTSCGYAQPRNVCTRLFSNYYVYIMRYIPDDDLNRDE